MVGSKIPRATMMGSHLSRRSRLEEPNLPAPVFFQDGRRQFDPQYHDVGRDTQGHFHQDGVEIDPPGQKQVVAIPVAADVDENGQPGQTVAEDAGQHRGTHQGVVLPAVEHINQQGHGIAAAAQRGAHQHVIGDPEPPGVAVTQIGNRAQAKEIAVDDEDATHQGQGGQDQKGLGDDLAA